MIVQILIITPLNNMSKEIASVQMRTGNLLEGMNDQEIMKYVEKWNRPKAPAVSNKKETRMEGGDPEWIKMPVDIMFDESKLNYFLDSESSCILHSTVSDSLCANRHLPHPRLTRNQNIKHVTKKLKVICAIVNKDNIYLVKDDENN